MNYRRFCCFFTSKCWDKVQVDGLRRRVSLRFDVFFSSFAKIDANVGSSQTSRDRDYTVRTCVRISPERFKSQEKGQRKIAAGKATIGKAASEKAASRKIAGRKTTGENQRARSPELKDVNIAKTYPLCRMRIPDSHSNKQVLQGFYADLSEVIAHLTRISSVSYQAYLHTSSNPATGLHTTTRTALLTVYPSCLLRKR